MKRSRVNPKAYYENYTRLGTSRMEIKVNDEVNIMIKQKPMMWSKEMYPVVKIEAPMYVYLDSLEDVKLEVGKYYMFQNEDIYLIKKKDTYFGFKAVNIDTGDFLYIRNADQREFAHVIKIRADKLRLQERRRKTSHGTRVFRKSFKF